MKSSLLLLSFGLVLGLPVLAQQSLPLDAATLDRLGLVFAPVTAPLRGDGARFPATVISSPLSTAQVFALQGGVIEQWAVAPGQPVAAGTALLTLRSQALLELQQAWVDARGAQQQAAAALRRDEQLFADGIIAEQRLQQTRREAQSADFAEQAAASALLQAGYTADELETLLSRPQAGRYQVRAATAGTVTSLLHQVGDLVDAGEPVLTLSSERLWISARLPARLAADVAVGQSLLAADFGVELQVRQLDRAIDTATQTVGLLAEFAGSAPVLPGQVINVQAPPPGAGVVVPAEAVVHNGDSNVVYVRSAGGIEARTLELRPVGGDYLVEQGLASGEEVVIRGAALVKGITLGLGGE